MSRLRHLIRWFVPPIVVDAVRGVRRLAGSGGLGVRLLWPLQDAEHAYLIKRMDAGDFDFDAETIERLCTAWRIDNSCVPYPSVLTRAYASGDAVVMNAKPLMEISYRLPYSHAYEPTQRTKYDAFLDKVEAVGIDFSNATVADVGCGFGGLLAVLQDRGAAAAFIGVEYARSAIEAMNRDRLWIRGVLADIETMTDDPAALIGIDVDIVLCTEVLEHLERPEDALRNLLNLAPRRGVAVTVPNGRVDVASQHINFWSPESWRTFVNRFAEEWNIVVGMCESPGSPGGSDNFAAFLPRTAKR